MAGKGRLERPGAPFSFSPFSGTASAAGVFSGHGPFGMGFDKIFFKNIGDLLEEYYKTYPCGIVSLTLRVGPEEYNVVKILKCDDTLLTFAFYSSPEKSHVLTLAEREKCHESIAWPALTVPYEAILWVELNPGKAAREREIGFTVPSNF